MNHSKFVIMANRVLTVCLALLEALYIYYVFNLPDNPMGWCYYLRIIHKEIEVQRLNKLLSITQLGGGALGILISDTLALEF